MININIANSKKCNGDYSMFITFDYDQKIVDVIRDFPSRFWNKDKKEWEVPFAKLGEFVTKLSDFDFNITGQYVTLEKPKAVMPEGFKFKTTPFQHQIDGFNYGLQYDRWLLGDEQGLGKTKQVIDIAVAKKLQKGYKHCLIICGVNGLKWNWLNEIHTHSDEEGWILGQRYKNRKLVIGSNADKLADLMHLESISNYFLITNVESMRDEAIVSQIAKYAKDKTIGIVAIDEIHKCFDYDTMITTDWGKLSIGSIVTNKLPVNVLSYNEVTNTVELKPVVNWFENTIAEKMIELTIEADNGEIKTIKCTPNHRFYTKNRGWVEAQDLTEDDDLTDCT